MELRSTKEKSQQSGRAKGAEVKNGASRRESIKGASENVRPPTTTSISTVQEKNTSAQDGNNSHEIVEENKRLKLENKALRLETEKAIETYHQSQEVLQDFAKKVEVQKQQLQSADQTILSLQQKLTDVSKDLERKHNELAQWKGEADRRSTEINEISAGLQQKESEVAKFNETITSLRNDLVLKSTDNKNFKKEIDDLRQSLQQVHNESRYLQDENYRLQQATTPAWPQSSPVHGQYSSYPDRRQRNQDEFYRQSMQNSMHNFASSTPRNPDQQNGTSAGNRSHTNQVSGTGSAKLKTYNGSTNWNAYHKQFEIHARRNGWDEEEKKENLFLHLESEAAEFFDTIEAETSSYGEIIERMGWMFGKKELPQTMRVTFENMRQKSDESLEQWAGRVRSVAQSAFIGLPVTYKTDESIRKFCQGLFDKDIATTSAIQKFDTLEQAINFVRSYNEVAKSIYGTSKKVRTVSFARECSDSDDDAYEVRQITRGRSNLRRNPSQRLPVKYNASDERTELTDSELKDKLASVLDAMAEMKNMFESRYGKSRDRSRSKSPDLSQIVCFHCKEKGHIKSRCPNLKNVTDVCYYCQEEGHRQYNCPKREADEKPVESIKSNLNC